MGKCKVSSAGEEELALQMRKRIFVQHMQTTGHACMNAKAHSPTYSKSVIRAGMISQSTTILIITYLAKRLNICWFQLFRFNNSVLSSVFYKFNIFWFGMSNFFSPEALSNSACVSELFFNIFRYIV